MVSDRYRRVHVDADRRKPFLITDHGPDRMPKAPCERGPLSRLLERMFAS